MHAIKKFDLISDFKPIPEQTRAINDLTKGLGKQMVQTLLGVTGSGKTFTVANTISNVGKNTLIISHNKTLAAQLYTELKNFFPNNNVGYFVSYYDYYQPEGYIPQTDTYIEKDTQINEKIEKMRLESTAMLLSGEPTIIISTVSCIYSLGNPVDWEQMSIKLKQGDVIKRNELLIQLITARYQRNDTNLVPGNFRVRGDTIDIIPAYSQDIVRVSMFGDEIERLSILHPITNKEKNRINEIKLYPAKHYLIDKDVQENAIISIKKELQDRLKVLSDLKRERLESRTKYDLEMIEEMGYCSGIENYSRHFDGRDLGEPAFCLLDFFGQDYIIIIDESHVTLPQLHAMYKGDHSRKKELINHGFRLPSAYDNRPLKFEEFEKYIKSNTIFVSATPSEYEQKNSTKIVHQVLRPTGLLDPPIQIRSRENQMDDLLLEIKKSVKCDQRVLITTLTKRMAEDLAEYLSKKNIAVRYMHSEIDGLERTEIIRQLRLGEFDVLVGINLLREGLDMPEVALVAILDADKEGFLRNSTSLIQTFGRAARNKHGRVIMYADTKTKSMNIAIATTDARRKKQIDYNKKHGITPTSIIKPIPEQPDKIAYDIKSKTNHQLEKDIIVMEKKMNNAAEELDFELAIKYREVLTKLKKELYMKIDYRKFKDTRGKTS